MSVHSIRGSAPFETASQRLRPIQTLPESEWLSKKRALLVVEARRWIGIVEQSGDNCGQMVERFQKTVDQVAEGEPWCMAFVQYCVAATDAFCEEAWDKEQPHCGLYKSEHCLTVWRKSKCERLDNPLPGALCFFQRYKNGLATAQGHVGIICSVYEDGSFTAIEGNVRAGAKDTRDGVWPIRHALAEARDITDGLKIIGFMSPWSSHSTVSG